MFINYYQILLIYIESHKFLDSILLILSKTFNRKHHLFLTLAQVTLSLTTVWFQTTGPGVRALHDVHPPLTQVQAVIPFSLCP